MLICLSAKTHEMRMKFVVWCLVLFRPSIFPSKTTWKPQTVIQTVVPSLTLEPLKNSLMPHSNQVVAMGRKSDSSELYQSFFTAGKIFSHLASWANFSKYYIQSSFDLTWHCYDQHQNSALHLQHYPFERAKFCHHLLQDPIPLNINLNDISHLMWQYHNHHVVRGQVCIFHD